MGSTKLPSKNLPRQQYDAQVRAGRVDERPALTEADFLPCSVCGKEVPMRTCEHGHPYSDMVYLEYPDMMDGVFINEGCIELDICQECMKAVDDTLRARGLRFIWEGKE